MNLQRQEDMMDAHFEALRQQGPAKARLIETAPNLPTDLVLLFTVVRLLWSLLRPVKPAPQFRADLGNRLTAEAKRRHTYDALDIERTPRGASMRWVAPVVAIGAASLVGAYAWKRRSRQQAEPEEALAA